MVDYSFFKSLPSNSNLALSEIFNYIKRLERFEDKIEVFCLLQTFCEKSGFKLNFPSFTSSNNVNESRINDFLDSNYPIVTKYKADAQYDLLFNSPIIADENTKQEIQAILRQLHEAIQQTEDVTPEHKDRLLDRVNSLQREFDKAISDWDLALGKIGRLGMTVKKVCEDAKPILDPINKLIGIIDRVTSEDDKLPTAIEAAKFYLPAGEENGDASE